jgi:hypothetical protein
MKSLSQIASKLEGVVVKAINEGECYAENDKKNFYLRPSSFPYCPLRFFLGLPKAFSRGKYEEASFSYYVRVGSATHAVIQEAVTLIVFAGFSVMYLKQEIKLDYVWAALCLLGAVYFVFRS